MKAFYIRLAMKHFSLTHVPISPISYHCSCYRARGSIFSLYAQKRNLFMTYGNSEVPTLYIYIYDLYSSNNDR